MVRTPTFDGTATSAAPLVATLSSENTRVTSLLLTRIRTEYFWRRPRPSDPGPSRAVMAGGRPGTGAEAEALRSRPIEGRDGGRQAGNRIDARIRDGKVVEGRSERGVKPELDDRVIGVAIGVEVEVQGIDNLV